MNLLESANSGYGVDRLSATVLRDKENPDGTILAS